MSDLSSLESSSASSEIRVTAPGGRPGSWMAKRAAGSDAGPQEMSPSPSPPNMSPRVQLAAAGVTVSSSRNDGPEYEGSAIVSSDNAASEATASRFRDLRGEAPRAGWRNTGGESARNIVCGADMMVWTGRNWRVGGSGHDDVG